MQDERFDYAEEEYSPVANLVWNLEGRYRYPRGWEVYTAHFMNDNFMSIAEHLGMTAKGY